jgi:hypothetical protein
MKFSLKPVFIGWITLLTQLPLQLFLTLWCGGFFGGLGKSFGIFPKDSQAPFIFIGALAFFGIPLAVYIVKKLNYTRTEYKFFDDHLEFEEGFSRSTRRSSNTRTSRKSRCGKASCRESMAWGRSIWRRSRPALPLPSAPFTRLASAMFRRAASACATFSIPTTPTKRLEGWWRRTTFEFRRRGRPCLFTIA